MTPCPPLTTHQPLWPPQSDTHVTMSAILQVLPYAVKLQGLSEDQPYLANTAEGQRGIDQDKEHQGLFAQLAVLHLVDSEGEDLAKAILVVHVEHPLAFSGLDLRVVELVLPGGQQGLIGDHGGLKVNLIEALAVATVRELRETKHAEETPFQHEA